MELRFVSARKPARSIMLPLRNMLEDVASSQ